MLAGRLQQVTPEPLLAMELPDGICAETRLLLLLLLFWCRVLQLPRYAKYR
jgi:hypothetical protein